MSRFAGQDKSIHDKTPRTGVLLTNLGTPEAPTAQALRTYLREFLSDPRVVEIPRLVWMIILHGIILRVRPAKSAKLYQSIWTEKGSPLMVISEQQRDKVKSKLAEDLDEPVEVALAMRYGQPSIESELNRFQKQGIDNIVVMPLYPQYAGPTTGSSFDAVTKAMKKWRWIPSLHFVSSYHQNEKYIDALAASVKEHIDAHGKPDKLVLSYHGMPKLFHHQGDPYYCFCALTTRALAQALSLKEEDFVMTFQSRFGKAEWLKPYTDETLENLAQSGVKHVAIMSPAFSADCLETLEELVEENKEVFVDAGGEIYHYIPCLNDRDDHIDAIVDIVKPYINRPN
ncbi:ferrochelatase [Thalassotalea eurytherma]|uniref:Ferrochelatase n=1 Tax=Thalassotalea eurytherma TaxID=1144278 RepID=A0ABQ6H472_9GAMM|nr:ferrochelatase [Thalassotalea eurytherma]GLX81646.1 ferrochelatase 2 [Thalassotalea eurytherma]